MKILLVEDNPGDVDLTLEAFEEGRIANHISVTNDGAEALTYLRREGDYAAADGPDLILLDLNLPGVDGFEVLRQIKQDKTLRRIPVIVMTTSEAEQDVLNSYDLQASAYITKPIEIDEFIAVVRSIEAFWLAFVKFSGR